LEAWGAESNITGYIPQVPHTYALYEGGYAIMNEHQVAIGETTCAAKFYGTPVTAGGLARIEISEMSKIALERADTARMAIQIMGDLATSLGFYAADWRGGDSSKGEGGEALTVIDKTEAWVFHVLCDDTGASAVWAAQRLEPDHVVAIANSFVIREIDPDSDSFMYSANMFDVAERNGFYSRSSGQPLDFLPTFGPMRSHSEYSTRRVWSVFRQVAPSLHLPGNTDYYGNDYPFSVKAERVLYPSDMMALLRDHFEGTPYDLTQGIAAGPYGDPTRFDGALNDNMTLAELLSGGYERAISMFRTSYSFVAQSRPHVPDVLALVWFANYNPSSCTHAPFYVSSDYVPHGYTSGSLFNYDNNVAFWNFAAVGNYAGRFYKYAMQDVLAYQLSTHNTLYQEVQQVEAVVLEMLRTNPFPVPNSNPDVIRILTEFTNNQGNKIIAEWRDLLPKMIGKFHDGYITSGTDLPTIKMIHMGYSRAWLNSTGYFLNRGHEGPGVILFSPDPASSSGSSDSTVRDRSSSSGKDGGEYSTASVHRMLLATVVLTAILSSMLTIAVLTYLLPRHHHRDLQDKNRYEYTPL